MKKNSENKIIHTTIPKKIITKKLQKYELKKRKSKSFKSRNSMKSHSTRLSSIDQDNIENGTFYYSDANFSNADTFSRDDFRSAQNESFVEQFDDIDEEFEDQQTIQDEDEDNERIIYQLHYHNWSSHTCPFPNSLLQFRRRVRIYMNEVINDQKVDEIGPTIVHCSDGCGRTGAYLCIDSNLEFSEEDGLYDVFGYAKRMKHSRKGLIENLVSVWTEAKYRDFTHK